MKLCTSIAADSVREQSLIVPVLVIPYTDEFINEQVTDGTTQKVKAVRQVINKRLLVFSRTTCRSRQYRYRPALIAAFTRC